MRILAFTLLLMTAAAASDGCAGGNWPAPAVSVAVIADSQPEYDESAAGQASERIPPACIRGVTNNRFQLPPGPLDVVVYYWQKWHVGKWMMTKAVPFLEKYLPILAKWEQNWEKARNAVILATPIVLKIMHKF